MNGEPKPASTRRRLLCNTIAVLGVLVFVYLCGLFAYSSVMEMSPWFSSLRGNEIRRGGAQEDRAATVNQNNLRNIRIAVHNHDSSQNQIPTATTFDSQGTALHGWHTQLLPFIEQQNIYNLIDLAKPWNDPVNSKAVNAYVAIYHHGAVPSTHDANGFPITTYAANVRLFAVGQPRRLDDFPNGTSNVLLIGEVAGNFKPWGYPLNVRDPSLGLNRHADGFGGPWTRGTHFLMADGSVRIFRDDTDPEFLELLAQPEGR